VSKIDEKAVCKSVFLTIWHCIFSDFATGKNVAATSAGFNSLTDHFSRRKKTRSWNIF